MGTHKHHMPPPFWEGICVACQIAVNIITVRPKNIPTKKFSIDSLDLYPFPCWVPLFWGGCVGGPPRDVLFF